jgi:hypothetical protein
VHHATFNWLPPSDCMDQWWIGSVGHTKSDVHCNYCVHFALNIFTNLGDSWRTFRSSVNCHLMSLRVFKIALPNAHALATSFACPFQHRFLGGGFRHWRCNSSDTSISDRWQRFTGSHKVTGRWLQSFKPSTSSMWHPLWHGKVGISTMIIESRLLKPRTMFALFNTKMRTAHGFGLRQVTRVEWQGEMTNGALDWKKMTENSGQASTSTRWHPLWLERVTISNMIGPCNQLWKPRTFGHWCPEVLGCPLLPMSTQYVSTHISEPKPEPNKCVWIEVPSWKTSLAMWKGPPDHLRISKIALNCHQWHTDIALEF